MEIYKKRLQHARQLMKQKDISSLLLTPSSDLYYMTGYSRPATDRFTALLLTEDNARFLYPALEQNYLTEIADCLEPVSWQEGENPFHVLVTLPDASHFTKKHVKFAAGGMIRGSWLLQLMELLPDTTWCDGNLVMDPLRRIKSLEEIEIIRKAQEMAENALLKLLQSGLEGKTVQQVSKDLRELRLSQGLESAGPGLIACGPDSASAHPVLSDYRITKGDTVMFDIGGTYKGYHADMTRTCAVGSASNSFREVYRIVLEAHISALKTAAPGCTCQTMDAAARQVIEDAGYGQYFTHRLGHGIGLDIHESPFAAKGNPSILETGNVLSNEPGIYLPGKFGIRIEDLIVITETGAESLNRMTKDLIIV